MDKQYDLDALYLHHGDWRTSIVKIEKINEKTIRMSRGVKIPKEEFSTLHKLTEEERIIYEREVIKNLSRTDIEVRRMIDNLNSLKRLLGYNDFISINKEKLEKSIDKLNDMLELYIAKPFKINNETYTLDEFADLVYNKNN